MSLRRSSESSVGLDLSVFLHQSFVPFIVPSDVEYHQKERARVYLERLTTTIYKGAKLLPFGSVVNHTMVCRGCCLC